MAVFSYVFIAHFLWACLTLRESLNFFLKRHLVHTLVLSNNPVIFAWISAKFVSTLLQCMLYQTSNFQHKANTSMYMRDAFTLYVDSCHNSDLKSLESNFRYKNYIDTYMNLRYKFKEIMTRQFVKIRL